VGSTLGQQRFAEGLLVREQQPRFEGWLPSSGRVEIRCRMTLSPRSMGALWLAGFEDDPEQLRCGELCVVEIFGRSVERAGGDASCEVGMGIKAFRDPALTQDFDAPRLPVDPAEMHTYAVDWDHEVAVFSVDGREVRRCPRPPTYPMQLMVAVYDFPEWSVGDDDHLVPALVVDHVAG
jgi:beta-glucanase (GH16 family)